MPAKDLQSFLKELEADGDLVRIKDEVDPILEISEIADRAMRLPGGGPALLFEKPKGAKFPLAINVLGAERRMLKAFGMKDYGELGERVHALLDQKAPQGFLDKLKMLPKLKELETIFPKIVKNAPCQEVVKTGDQVDLSELPIQKCWPQDGGRFITMGLVTTKDRESGKRNFGMYRMQVYDKNTTGMHWQIHHHGAKHHRQRIAHNERSEVAVAIGAAPSQVFCAILPAPDDIDEMMFAGFATGDAVELVKCKTVDLEVPAMAEFVLEGYVEPHEKRTEGPFGDHTGFYTLEEEYPVFHITCITHRKNPIYQSTIVGKPPKEDCHMGYAVERLTLPILKKQFAEIEDMHMPWAGVFHNLMLISIHKQYPGHARKIMHAMWGMGQVALEKFIVVFDSDVNLHDYNEVVWKACNNLDPQRDMEIAMGPIDVLDHSSRAMGYGSKVGFDCTKKWPEEGFTRRWPDEMTMSPEVKKKVDEVWGKLGIKSR